MIKHSHSSFWLGDRGFNRLSSVSDPIELAKYQRSIGKFVKILTKESIPITFHTKDGNSYTDGESVTISSEINQENFDSIVGLALHEGSHIKLTNFETLKQKESYVQRSIKNVVGHHDSDLLDEILQNFKTFKSLLNYIEDRRIDYYVYTNSPGYKPYYEAMYDRYFRDEVIDKAIISNEYTDLDVKSYMFRIINFLNKETRLDVLPQLEEIYNLIFDNVPSIDSTVDSMDISVKIYRIIKDNIEEVESEENEDGDSGDSDEDSQSSNSDSNESSENSDGSSSTNEDEDSDEDSGGSNESSDGGDEDEDSDEESTGSNSSDEENDSDEKSTGSNESSDEDEENDSDEDEGSELSDIDKQNVEVQIKKQEEFLDGQVDKSEVNESTKKMVDALSQIDIESEHVEYTSEYGEAQSMEVALIRGFTDEAFTVFSELGYRKQNIDNPSNTYTIGLTSEINEGINLGKRLGKKLQIRNRERTTTFNRRKKGKLDKRRIHALGHGDSTVFNQYVTEQHADAFLHISIDGSGSMSSNQKFSNSIKSAVAMAQMADVTNIDIEISIRYTAIMGGKNLPIVWIVYDSRKDSMKVIKKYFKYLKTMGMTPEGLCFSKIMKQLPIGTDSLKTYFINYSDGMPNYSNYGGTQALEHTRKQVNEIRRRGYTVLSFFIAGGISFHNRKDSFEQMYGKDSSFVDPTSLTDLVKTLQKTFMSK